jgi:hypothetical protein
MFTLGLLASSEICGVLEAVWYRFLDSFRSCFSVFLHWQPPLPPTHTLFANAQAHTLMPWCEQARPLRRDVQVEGRPRGHDGMEALGASVEEGASAIDRARVRRRGELRCS